MEKRASRLSRNSNGRRIVTHGQLTGPEFELLRYLARFPFNTVKHTAAALDRKRSPVQRNIQVLKDERNDYLDLCTYQREHFFQQFMTADLAYGVTEKSRTMLREKGYPVHTNEFSGSYFYHTLFAIHIRTSFDIAAAQIPEVEVIPWHELKDDPRISIAAKDGPRPNLFKIPQHIRKGTWPHTLIPDSYPFVVKSRGKAYPFLGIEADMGTEPISTTIRAKLAYYTYILETDLHKTLFGFPKAYIAFFTRSELRMQNMLAEAEATVPKSLWPYFLFMHTIAPGDVRDKPLPTGYAVTGTYMRTGNAPLILHRV